MNKRLRAMVVVMILIIIAGGIYLWSQNRGNDPLEKLDPKSYDVTTTCARIDKNILICNKGFDAYLCLDDAKFFLQKSKTVIDENGDERTYNDYETSTLSQLKKMTKTNDEVPIYIWLSSRGKVETVMILETSLENKNASLAVLGDLDPASYTSANTVLQIGRKEMKLAPINYDEKDKAKYEGTIKTYKFAKKVDFYHLEITNFKEEKDKILRNIKYEKTTYGNTKKRLADGRSNAYVWIDKNGKIYAVMTFVETTK